MVKCLQIDPKLTHKSKLYDKLNKTIQYWPKAHENSITCASPRGYDTVCNYVCVCLSLQADNILHLNPIYSITLIPLNLNFYEDSLQIRNGMVQQGLTSHSTHYIGHFGDEQIRNAAVIWSHHLDIFKANCSTLIHLNGMLSAIHLLLETTNTSY